MNSLKGINTGGRRGEGWGTEGAGRGWGRCSDDSSLVSTDLNARLLGEWMMLAGRWFHPGIVLEMNDAAVVKYCLYFVLSEQQGRINLHTLKQLNATTSYIFFHRFCVFILKLCKKIRPCCTEQNPLLHWLYWQFVLVVRLITGICLIEQKVCR